MVTLSDSMVSSSARSLPIRKRPDLSARRQHYLGRSYWVVKEPVGLNYFRFQEEEYAILQMLDGETSLDEIKDRFEDEFPPQKITLEELQQFLGMLHRSGLVIADVGGQGRQLRKRRDERRRKELLGAMSNILCLRFKGVDPERFLNWLFPKVRWLFTPTVLVICVILWISALSLVLAEFDTFRSKLPSFYQFFGFRRALGLLATLGIVKILHEFGHGLTCKKFGGECHEMGIMVLVLTPCLYCNVSDSWMLPSKWQRAMIGAAGIFVELTLASIATFIWWFTEPGLWHYLCLNIMFIASVSTLLFNGNPLLRYDGYYVLADLVEIPNLRQKATTILTRKLGELCMGLEPPEDPFLPQRNQVIFMIYTVAAVMYRWFILASILFFLYRVFKPYRLEIIGHAIILTALVGLVVMPVYKVGKFFYVPGRWDKVKKPRMYASLGLLAALLAAVLFVPLPHSVMCTLEIQARDAKAVYVDVDDGGCLDQVYVEPGDLVAKDQPLARLTNIDVDLEIEKLEGEQQQDKMQWETLDQQRFHDPRGGATIRSVEESLEAVKKKLADKREEQASLVLRAPIGGVVLPPPAMPKRELPDGQLPGWSRTPLEPENLGAHLVKDVQFCQVGDPKQLEAILVVDQVDVEFVREMLNEDNLPSVEIRLNELPHETLHSLVTEISTDQLRASPRSLARKSGGDLPTTTDRATGAERPQSTSYQARALLGLYGHDARYRYLRGKLEFSPGNPDQEGEGTWYLRYISAEGEPDKFGGRLMLTDPALLSGYQPGDFVAVRGTLASQTVESPTAAEGDSSAAAGAPTGGATAGDATAVDATANGATAGDAYEIASISRLDPANALLRVGLTGRAKVHTRWLPIGTRIWRFISHTFNFRL